MSALRRLFGVIKEFRSHANEQHVDYINVEHLILQRKIVEINKERVIAAQVPAR